MLPQTSLQLREYEMALAHTPVLLDELLDPRLLDAVPDWAAFRTQLSARLEELEPDTEQQMDTLREVHHAQVFRLLTQDIAGLLTVEQLADHLSELADVLLDAAIARAWKKMPKHHIETPRFAVISYGKLGGKELGVSVRRSGARSGRELRAPGDAAQYLAFAADFIRAAVRDRPAAAAQRRLRPGGEFH